MLTALSIRDVVLIERLDLTFDAGLTVDSLKVAILAALHIADELHRLKRLHEQTDQQLAARSAECAEMLDRVLKSRAPEQPNGNLAYS